MAIKMETEGVLLPLHIVSPRPLTPWVRVIDFRSFSFCRWLILPNLAAFYQLDVNNGQMNSWWMELMGYTANWHKYPAFSSEYLRRIQYLIGMHAEVNWQSRRPWRGTGCWELRGLSAWSWSRRCTSSGTGAVAETAACLEWDSSAVSAATSRHCCSYTHQTHDDSHNNNNNNNNNNYYYYYHHHHYHYHYSCCCCWLLPKQPTLPHFPSVLWHCWLTCINLGVTAVKENIHQLPVYA